MYERTQTTLATKVARVTSKSLRVAATAAFTYVQFLSVWDLMQVITDDPKWQGVGAGLINIGLVVVNWGYWTRPAEENSMRLMRWAGEKCGIIIELEDDPEQQSLVDNNQVLKQEVKYKCAKGTGLTYISLASAVATFAMFSSTIRFAFAEMLNVDINNPALLDCAYVSGGISTCYVITTELWTLWANTFRWKKNSDSRKVANCPTIRIVGTTICVSNFGLRSWVSVFLESKAVTKNVGARAFIASLFSAMYMIINFSFQANNIIQNTIVMRKIEALLKRTPKPVKVVILVSIGTTTTIVGASVSHFSVRKLMEEIFNNRLHRHIKLKTINAIAATNATFYTEGNLLGVYAETIKVIWGHDGTEDRQIELMPLEIELKLPAAELTATEQLPEDFQPIAAGSARSLGQFGIYQSSSSIVPVANDDDFQPFQEADIMAIPGVYPGPTGNFSWE